MGYNSQTAWDYAEDNRFDPDYPKCANCTDTNNKFVYCSDFLEEIIHQLYGKKDFDKELLDESLRNLCSTFEIKDPHCPLVISAIKAKKDRFFYFSLDLARQLSLEVI